MASLKDFKLWIFLLRIRLKEKSWSNSKSVCFTFFLCNRSGPNSIGTCMGVITWQNVCIFAYVLISCFIAIFAIDVVLPEFQLRLMCLQHVYILLQEKPMRPYFLILPTEITPISKLRKHIRGRQLFFFVKNVIGESFTNNLRNKTRIKM